MIYRRMFFYVMTSILCCIYCPAITAAAAPNRMNMSQMQDFEKELEEANKAIEEWVSSLSPEEQADFNRQVEEMSQMFENMSEDEFEKFLGEMFAEEPMSEPNPFPEVQPVALPEKVEVVLSAEDKKKTQTAIKILDDVIKQSNLFMVLVNSSPELPNRITRWGEKGDISNWQAGATWDTFKLELESFVQKLYKAQEQDVHTKQYKYLLNLIADEGLYNNIIQLQSALNDLLPAINLPEFGIQKLNAQSKNAIKDILKKYTEGFYLLTIPTSLDALFEKYAPEAEKIKTEEEAANKRSLEAARQTRTPAAATEAGYGDSGYGYDYGYGYGNDYGYNPYDYGSYGNDYNDYYPDYGYGNDYGTDSGTTGGGKGGGGSSGGGGKSGGGGAGKGKEEGKDEGKKTGSKEKFVPEYETERSIADIKTSMSDIAAAMHDEDKNPTALGNLAETINTKDVDVILAGSTLPAIVDKKLDTIIKAMETVEKKKLNVADLGHYKNEIQKTFDKNKKELESLRDAIDTFAKPENIEKEKKGTKKTGAKDDEKSKKTDISKLSAEKQWAYFGGKETDLKDNEETKKLKEAIKTPVSLLDIKDKIDKILKEMKKFSEKKSNIPVVKEEKKEEPKKEDVTDITLE
jgi:hypothetical protein